jgi:hypothetical protein
MTCRGSLSVTLRTFLALSLSIHLPLPLPLPLSTRDFYSSLRDFKSLSLFVILINKLPLIQDGDRSIDAKWTV